MTKDELITKHKQYLFKCVTTYYKDPLVIDHAKNQYIWDLDGRQYLDFLGGIVTISVGHSNDKVTAKIKAQIDRLQHCSPLFITEALVALAEKLAQIAPGKLEKCYFTNSGTEANEVAVLTARMAMARSSASPVIRLILTPGAGSNSYMVTTGPGETSVT